MKNRLKPLFFVFCAAAFIACSNDDVSSVEDDDDVAVVDDVDNDGSDTDGNGDTANDPDPVSEVTLHAAFAEFDDDYTDIYLDGNDVVIEALGEPNHTTPYYSEGHDLYVEPTVTNERAMTPTRIDTATRDLALTLTVSSSPEIASSTTTTSLGPIGVAVSGAYIYNDEEGNGALDAAAVSLDYTGGHIGPDYYHYHLEPKAFTNDDDNLVGIIADGFFLYGRRDYPSNDYPTDLDASGGHFGPTPHNPDGEYHYHIINEVYSTTNSYITFAGPYMGTPNEIN